MGMELQAHNVKALADFLRRHPDAVQTLASDPKRLMAEFGVEVDDATAEALSTKLGDRRGKIAQASIIHVDL